MRAFASWTRVPVVTSTAVGKGEAVCNAEEERERERDGWKEKKQRKGPDPDPDPDDPAAVKKQKKERWTMVDGRWKMEGRPKGKVREKKEARDGEPWTKEFSFRDESIMKLCSSMVLASKTK